MSALPRTYPKWPGLVALTALGISFLTLWIGFVGPNKSEILSIQAAQFSVRYMESGSSGSWGPIEKIIPVVDGFDETYEFSKSDRDYKLQLTSKMDRLKTLNYEVQFCQVIESECIDIHVPRLSVVPGQNRRMSTRSRSAVGPNKEVIILHFSIAPTPEATLAPEG